MVDYTITATVTDSQGNATAGQALLSVSSPYNRRLSGDQPSGFTVPAGENWKIDGLVTTPANIVVNGTLNLRPGDTLRFRNVNEANYVGGGMDPVASDVGLWVMGAGKLDAVGTPKVSWNRIGDDPTWLAADELRVAPIAVGDYGSAGFAAFAKGSPVPRARPDVPTAEVLNLTKDCVIEGTPGGRAHVFIRSSVPQTISNVKFQHLGPRKGGAKVLGRWPVHFHMMGDASRGSLVEDCIVTKCGSHAYVAHNSHGVIFRRCVAYDNFEEAFWWDQNPPSGPPAKVNFSNDIIYDRCVAALVYPEPPTRGSRMGGFNFSPSTLNNSNKMIGCVAVGVQSASEAAGFVWPEGTFNEGVWVFQDCIAHNNKVDGSFSWLNTGNVHLIERFTAYRNGKAGIEHGAYVNPFVYRDVILIQNVLYGVLEHARSSSVGACRYERPVIKDSPKGFKEGEIKFPDAPPIIVCAPMFENVAQHYDETVIAGPESGTPTFEERAVC